MARRSDIVVIGAGVMGLWTALTALRAGFSVTVLERATVGAGASGGIVGALAPHMPDRWNPKKQFQLEALVALKAALLRLEDETGHSTGFRQSGRLQPILPGQLRFVEERLAGAREHWGDLAKMEVVEAATLPHLTPPETGQWMFDTLTACLNPKATCEALALRIRALGGDIQEGVTVKEVTPHSAHSFDGAFQAEHIVLAAGVDGFGLLEPALGTSLGRGEKGQAALLRGSVPPEMPIIYSDGLYIIAHKTGDIAVGSTSERDFKSGTQTDAQLDDLIARAQTVAPFLRDMEVVARWAGVRPRGNGRDPMLGPVPGVPGVFTMMAGFKISFGIAEKASRLMVSGLQTGAFDLPPTFTVDHHLAASPQTTPSP